MSWWKQPSMNFEDAVLCHSEWKRRLHEYAESPDHSLKVDEVAASDRCKTGKWIRGEGRKYSVYPEYAKLIAEHARFHKAAAEIVRRADCGDDMRGEFALGVGSEFSLASSAVVLALMDMKRRHEMEERSRQEPAQSARGRAAGGRE
ncbi:MAG: CZB domain-containing protein [Terriglobales bacterium]